MFTKEVMFLLSSVGVVQALFLSFYLFTLRERRTNMLLGLMLMGLTLRIGKSVLLVYLGVDPWLRNIAIAFMLTTGPLLLMYGRALFRKHEFKRDQYLHFIPFVSFLLLSPLIPNDGSVTSRLVYASVVLHLAAYLAICWATVREQPSTARLLPWYRNIVIGVSLIWLMYGGVFVGLIPYYVLVAIFFSLLMYVFSYLLLKRHVFALEKYNSSTMDPATSAKILLRVKSLFENEDTFLSNDISLKTIAKSLSVSPRELSQVINEHESKNFPEFVNHYRISKAKALLSDPQRGHEKIATIAYDCGFGNVTSFNIAFKSATQLTPTQFRQLGVPLNQESARAQPSTPTQVVT